MNAPYQVWVDRAGDHDFFDCETFDQALGLAIAENKFASALRRVRVIGEGAEGGGGDDGTGWNDGLTDDERERCEEAGL